MTLEHFRNRLGLEKITRSSPKVRTALADVAQLEAIALTALGILFVLVFRTLFAP